MTCTLAVATDTSSSVLVVLHLFANDFSKILALQSEGQILVLTDDQVTRNRRGTKCEK